MRLTRVIGIGAGLAVVAVAATSGVMALDQEGTTTVTAYFDRATGVYAGSDLRILGVKVGSVTSVEPRGEQVRVTLRVDKDVKVPEGAHAVLVAPSLVADRYIQLAPAYTGGATLADGAVLPAEGNAAPVEVDQLYASITELSTALGPDGANANGALARLLDTGAKNLDGNGKAIGDSIAEFGKATKTLDKSSTDLFDTLSYLQSFTTMLKDNDGEVRSAEQQLNSVTGFLAEDKENLSAALAELSTALAQVKTFIEDNRESLKTNVDALVPLTQVLVDQRASLAESLDTLPLTAGNLVNAYDPVNRTLDGRTNLNELSMGGYFPDQPSAGTTTTGTTASGTTASGSGGAASLSGLAAVDASRQAELPVLPLPAVGTVYGTPEKTATGTDRSGTDTSGTEEKEAGR